MNTAPAEPAGTLSAAAAKTLAEHGSAALSHLWNQAEKAFHSAGAIFSRNDDGNLVLLCGEASESQRLAADEYLDSHTECSCSDAESLRLLPLTAEGALVGLWVISKEADLQKMEEIAPLLSLALRLAQQRAELESVRRQVERGIREVATVYEIGQATDKVEIDRLLDLITQKAAQVMEAQACSLMLRLPDSDALVISASWGLPDEVVENTRIFVGEGIAGRVAATGQPLRLNALADDPAFRDAPPSRVPDVSSSLCMPMKDENGQVQGVLCIRRRVPMPTFTDEDVRLFSIFATQATLAINNAQLYAKLSHKLQELSTLSALTDTVTSSLDLDEMLSEVADAIVDVVHFDRCRIYLEDLETGRFSARITRGFARRMSADEEEPDLGLGEGVVGAIAQSQSGLLLEDMSEADKAQEEYAKRLGMLSFYAQPIMARGRCIGVVVVSNADIQRPLRSGIPLLSTFVNQAGIAIENARFYEVQKRRYSELTTLYEISRTLAATSGVQKAAETVSALAAKITESDAELLLLFDTAQEGLSVLHWHGVGEELGRQLRSCLSPIRVPEAARRLRIPCIFTQSDTTTPFGADWEPIMQVIIAQHAATALVPLISSDAHVGFLVLCRKEAAFGSEELKLISIASSQAAAVLSSAASYEWRIGQRELELSAVYELMQKVRSATTLNDALNSILDIVASLVWSDGAQLYTLNDDQKTLTVRAARGPQADALIGSAVLPLDGSSIAAQALRERTALISSARNTQENPHMIKGVRSLMALPLVVGEESIGVLTMQSSIPDLYTEESVTMLHLVASQAATIYREMTSLRALTRYTDNILRSIAAGVLTLDKNGIIVTWNRRAADLVRMSASEIVGAPYMDFVSRLCIDESMREETLHMIALTAQTGKIYTHNELCCHLEGDGDIYLNLSASELQSESGDYLGVVVVFEDVTNEVLQREELERVGKLAETGQLAANIAHELRNPLSSIKGAAQLLRKELPPDTVVQHGEFLEIIIEEANGLNRITTEFLEFSRQTPPEMQEVLINPMITRLLQFMGPALQSGHVHLAYTLEEDIPTMMLDRAQIEQVIRNLVINAAQAMPRGGYISVGTRYYPNTEFVEVSFTDTGVGITAEKLEKIFAPFFTTKTKGTGLGLAIARKIVEVHGGRLTARSTPGEGSTFSMHLPLKPLYPHRQPPARLEISDQRSDGTGGIYDPTRLLHI